MNTKNNSAAKAGLWREKLKQSLAGPKASPTVLLLLVALYGILLAGQINRPFLGPHEDNNSFYGIAAANWLKYGPLELKFGNLTPFGFQGDYLVGAEREFYLRHPQFSIAPLALVYQLFGIGEWQTRVVPIIFSLLSLILFWFVLEQAFHSPPLTVLSSVFYTFFPLGVYYGQMMVYEPLNRFFILLAFLLLLLLEKTRRNFYLFLLLPVIVLGGLVDWPFFFAVFGFWLYVLLKKDFSWRKPVLVLLPLAAFLSFALTVLQVYLIRGAVGLSDLVQIFLFRATSLPSLGNWLLSRIYNEVWNLTEIGFLLSLAGVWLYFFRNTSDRLPGLVLLLPGVLYTLVFSNGAYYHQYWTFELTLFWALAAGWAYLYLWSRWRVLAVGALLVFGASGVWYSQLLARQRSVAAEDIVLEQKLGEFILQEDELCLVGPGIPAHILLYLPRGFQNYPCAAETRHFLLVDWESPEIAQETEIGILERGFGANLKQHIFSVALLAKLANSWNQLEVALENYIQKRALYPEDGLVSFAQKNARLIQDKNLLKIECARTLCLYSGQ